MPNRAVLSIDMTLHSTFKLTKPDLLLLQLEIIVLDNHIMVLVYNLSNYMVSTFHSCLQVLRMFQNGDGREQLDSIHHHMWHPRVDGFDQQGNSLN